MEKNSFWSRLLIIASIFFTFALSAIAEQYGDFWYTDNGSEIAIINYTGSFAVLTIPNTINGKPVTSIGDYSFKGNIELTSVTIPDSVTSIGVWAFSYCTSLTNIVIPAGITSIEDYAFYDTGLTSVTIPAGVTSIGGWAFSYCTSLTNIVIPAGITSIEDYAFYDTGLTSVTIPAGVTSISTSAFSCCTSLTNIVIPAGITSIEDYAFLGCTSLMSATFLGDEPSMGTQVFASCASNFMAYYIEGAFGFTSPIWMGGYPSAILSKDTLSVNSSGAASVLITSSTKHGGTTNYTIPAVHGMTVSLTAPDIVGMHFTGWTGDVASSLKTVTFIMSADTTVTANYAINTYSVVFSASSNGSITGTKTQTVNHAANCTEVTAVPSLNYHFSRWTGDYTGVDNPLTLINVSSSKAIAANFIPNTATLTLKASGNGTAGFTGVNPLNTATATAILATPAANNHFLNWTVTSGSAIVANTKSASTTVMLTGAHNSSVILTANFAENIAPTAVPAAPVILASDGTYEDRIVITWKAVPSATSYEVYRNGSNTTNGAKSLGIVADCIFEDNTAAHGSTYWYFAKAKNSIGTSIKFSVGNSGYVATAPSSPGAVTASDGTYFDKVHVSWAKVIGATSYLVFRTNAVTPAPNPNSNTDLIGETTALFLDDLGDDIVPQIGGVVQKYYYWIAAKNKTATTVISKPNEGYLSNKGPAAITASNGVYSDRIVVTWTEVLGATAYDVWRYTDSKFTLNKTKIGDAVEALEYEDTTATTGTPFYYKVNAKYSPGSYDSALSLIGAAGKASGTSNPTATNINNGATSSDLVDMAKGSILYFSTEVPFGTTRLIATINGTNNSITNDCNVYAKFANYPTISSYNAKGLESNINETLTVSNPSAGTWYFMLYGATSYTNVTLTINCYSVADIVLTQIPVNDLPVPFTTVFKGKVIDESGTGVPNMTLQVRNPITGLTNFLPAKTDTKGFFSYSAVIDSEGEHTFDFFFSDMPDTAKGTASHTVATMKGCLVEEPNNFFDFSRYLPATPITIPLQEDVVGLQYFLNTRNGWDHNTIDITYETMWVNSTLVKAKDDSQLAANLDEGLYMFLYGVEGAAVGNDTTTAAALSAIPFVVHIETSKMGTVLTALNTLGVISDPQKAAIEGGSIGIVAVTSLSDPDEGLTPLGISLLACEQLELLTKIAGNSETSSVIDVSYSGVAGKQVKITLANGRTINVVAAGFVK